MNRLTLKNNFQTNATIITNDFIDNYMAQANGEFVKVYLFVLRHLDAPSPSFTVSMIADCLNNTENDILRAFRYWESEGLLSLERNGEGKITAIEVRQSPTAAPAGSALPQASPFPPKEGSPEASLPPQPAQPGLAGPAAKAIPMAAFKAQKELKSLLFIAEQYLGKTLSKTDMDAITYFYDTLGMSAELIEYLIESCAENGHKSIHYIQKVALSWADEGIASVEQAREHSFLYSKGCYAILNAFGIKNRGPAAAELTFMKRWTGELGFSPDIIQEACSRTIAATHQPSFEYADTILRKWHESQVRHLKDIAALDEVFQKEKSLKKPADIRQKPVSKNLNNFERRSYDMESLEEQLLNSN